MSLRIAILFAGCVLAGAVKLVTGYAAVDQPPAPDALAGFNTPSFDSAHSISNGLVERGGDTFALDQQIFELNHSAATGLGPVYNATACVNCHENPNTGGASQITELRVGHNDASGHFVNPSIQITGSTIPITGRSIVNDRAICPEAQEHVPATENIRALRAVLNTLGDGFVEAIDDNTLTAIADGQPGQSDGMIHGLAVPVQILEAPPGTTRIGRFGWKDQHGSLLSFAADAYLNEMGVTNPLKKTDTTAVCKTTTDPEDTPDSHGLADIDHFAQFIRGTMAPPRDEVLMKTAAARQGEAVFTHIGCAICHVESITTAPPDKTLVTFTVPDALGNKTIHPFGDFLLHDVGTGDGIVQGGPQETANMLRTVPLWGLRTKSRFMHDLKSLSLEDAIHRHKGEASEVEEHFEDLSVQDKAALITFLNSL